MPFSAACLLALLLAAGCGREQASQEEPGAIPVEVLAVAPGPLNETETLSGLLEAYRAVDIVSEAGGEIVAINHDVGDRVPAGRLLAAVDKQVARESLKQAEAAALAARARFDIAKNEFRRDSTLLQTGDIAAAVYENSRLAYQAAEADMMNAEAARALAQRALAETDIRTPFAGTLSRRYCDIGTYIVPGQPVFRIVDIDSLRLKLGISQKSITRLAAGMRVTITSAALAGRVFEGTIRSISPEADEVSHTFSIEVIFPNPPDDRLRDGLVVDATLLIEEHPAVLSIPREAVLKQKEESFVFVVEDSLAKRRTVELGPIIGERYLIRSGLREGDQVVVVGMRNLRRDSRVEIEKRAAQ
jgi:RND family efflux transporter MFP subunit